MRLSSEERAAHVALWRESGLSKAAYCRECGLPYQTFVGWCREQPDARPDAAEGDRFIALVDDRRSTDAGAPAALQVHMHADMALSFAASAPAEWVAAVIRAMRSC
jgi:hypothetical protein